jgi:hypothetical protein
MCYVSVISALHCTLYSGRPLSFFVDSDRRKVCVRFRRIYGILHVELTFCNVKQQQLGNMLFCRLTAQGEGF